MCKSVPLAFAGSASCEELSGCYVSIKLTMAYMHLSRKPDSLFDIKIISLINN